MLAFGLALGQGVPAEGSVDTAANVDLAMGQFARCDTAPPTAPQPRAINLVLDDSGSMFARTADGPPLDRWSQAKYSLEVFAAMLDRADTLNVYRLSDFADTTDASPAVTLKGSEPASVRVARIHEDLVMQGRDTPYAPVEKAYRDLAGESAPNKWLVILSDGAFGRPYDAAGVVTDALLGYARENTVGEQRLRVAFLAIGENAPVLSNEPTQGLHFQKAADSGDLLAKMTYFANIIFERDVLAQVSANKINVDIPLSEVMVFAQGANVDIGDLSVGGTSIPPASTVPVRWTTNPAAVWGLGTVPAVPNENLNGKLSTFRDVPAGSGAFAIAGDDVPVEMFYKPQVSFGVLLQDADGQTVDASKIVAGTYTVYYGFMDEECQLIDSPLLGETAYSAQILRDGEIVEEAFASGDELDLARGAVQLRVSARYLGESRADAEIDLTVLQQARPTGFEVEDRTFAASELAANVAPERAIAVTYGLESGTGLEPFTPEEWASITAADIVVETSANLAIEVVKGAEPGQLYLVPHAPGGDVLAADTGDLEFVLVAEHRYDEQLYMASATATTTVVDDIPWWDRFVRWFSDIGWWLLLLTLLSVLVIGYLIKPRFSRKIKPRPSVVGVPMSVSARPEDGRGKFVVQTGRRFLPFVADTATYSYVPTGVSGFRSMKLKARRGGRMQLTNWKQIAERGNVSLNGNDLNEETPKMPVLGPSSNITATVPQQVRYESYLNA